MMLILRTLKTKIIPGHFEAIQVNQIELHFPMFLNNPIAVNQLFSDPTKIQSKLITVQIPYNKTSFDLINKIRV